MATRFQLAVDQAAPRQQSDTTCGSACLLVARMVLDPTFAEALLGGSDSGRPGHAARPATAEADARFAAQERLVAARTNAVVGPAGVQLPWPRALGTPPWGARAELQRTGASPGGSYSVGWFRLGGTGVLKRAYAALLARVTPGRPALLYVGNRWLPRHVVLVVPGEDRRPLLYEPSAGRVLDLPAGPFVRRELGLAGWDVPWAAVWDRAVP